MALKYRQKKSIRHKRRFLKRKSVKTYRRARKVMRGGMKWNVTVYYNDTAIDYGSDVIPNKPFYKTPGIFTDISFPSDNSKEIKHIFGTLTLPELEKTFSNQKFWFINEKNKYVATTMMEIHRMKPRLLVSHFEKDSEISEESAIGAAQFPIQNDLRTPLLENRQTPKNWRRRTFFSETHDTPGRL